MPAPRKRAQAAKPAPKAAKPAPKAAKPAPKAAEPAPKAAEPAPQAEATAKTSEEQPTATERVGLHNLKPAPGSRRPRKRVGRGEGSGTGKTSGRGQKGWGSRSGAKRRARFEGGQMPIHMRMRKLRGPHSKGSMPFEPFRTHTQAVNLKDLEARFEKGEAVTLEALKAKGLATRKEIPVKILAKGDLSKPLTVHAHGFSAKAREAIEAAGGTCEVLPAASQAAEKETARAT